MPCATSVRIAGDGEIRQEVFDVGGFGQGEPAVFHKWQMVSGEGRLQVVGMRRRSEEHGYTMQTEALLL